MVREKYRLKDKKIYKHMKKVCKKVVSMVNLKPTKIIKISPDDFDPRGNIEMTGYEGMRGGEVYKQPP